MIFYIIMLSILLPPFALLARCWLRRFRKGRDSLIEGVLAGFIGIVYAMCAMMVYMELQT